MIENPQSFIVSTECSKAAEQHGFRRRLTEENGWAAFQSTTAQGTIWIAAEGPSGPWFLALEHPGVIREVGLPQDNHSGPGLTRFRFDDLGQLYDAMPKIYRLTASLPDAPLRVFRAQIANLPRSTEAERLVVQRVGQDIFRRALLEYWDSQCPLTGIADAPLLRASHIIPWKDCETDIDRLDVYNGLLLSALWDQAFDAGLITFGNDGLPTFSPALSKAARKELRWSNPIHLTDNHRARLDWHRSHYFRATL